MARELNKNICYRCSKPIDNARDLSVDHINDWLYADDPKHDFYSYDNIRFSHLHCNVVASNFNNAGRKSVIRISPNGKTEHFPSILAVTKTLDVSYRSVSKGIKRSAKSGKPYKGYNWIIQE